MVSVIRASYVSADQCKQRGKAIENANATYIGFAKVIAGQVRECGSDLEDFPDDFKGHAHIVHGMAAPPKGEAAPPEFLARLNCLAKKAKVFLDPDPANDTWTGADILAV